jgi:hypothetical protein
VTDFVIRNSIPFLARLTGSIVNHMDREKRPFFALVSNETQNITGADLEVAESASQHFPVVVATCAEDTWVCLYTSISLNTTRTEFLVFDRSKRIFWVYRSPNRSVDRGEKWIEGWKTGK